MDSQQTNNQHSQVHPIKQASSHSQENMPTKQVPADVQKKKYKKYDKENQFGSLVKERIKTAAVTIKSFNIFGCNESTSESESNNNSEQNRENGGTIELSFRKKYCLEILKYLIFGYFEIMHELEVKRVLQEDIDFKTQQFIKDIESIDKAVHILKQKSIQIEEWMFKLYNFHVQEGVESKMYRFQFANFIRNLADPDNIKFRGEVIMGVIAPEIVAMMNELDMMEPRKKQYIFTKNKSLLDQKKTRKLLIKREERYEEKKKLMASKQVMQTKKCSNYDDCEISYFLSKEVVNDMELDLMKIPFKATRKVALANLKQVFHS